MGVPLLGSGADGSSPDEQLAIEFTSGAMTPPHPPQGPIGAFTFAVPGLRIAMERAGVVSLRKLLPWFTPETAYTTNALGEEIVLADMSRHYVAYLGTGRGVLEALPHLRNRPGLARVAPDHGITALTTAPNDPIFGVQWGLNNTAQPQLPGALPDNDVNCAEAWDTNHGGGLAHVAVIDTGADTAHVDLAPRVRGGFNVLNPNVPPVDDHDTGRTSHGTAVTGIIGASGNNALGVTGVSWGPRIAPVKVLNHFGLGTTTHAAAGIDWARQNGIPIVNMSFGGPQFNPVLARASRNAALGGVFMVAAMGNHDSDAPFYPAADDPTTFAVGALWYNGRRWVDMEVDPSCNSICDDIARCASTFGPWIDAVAPGGRGVATTKRNNQYFDLNPGPPATPWCSATADEFAGTSAAAPFATGVAALLLDYNQNLLGDDLGEIMKRTARDVTLYGIGRDDTTGYGLVRADAALAFVRPPRQVQQAQVTPTLFSQDTGPITFIGVTGLPDTATYNTIRWDLRATHTFAIPYQATPDAWYRISGTRGVRAATGTVDYYRDPPSHATIASVGSSQITLETHLYELQNAPIQWYPTSPDSARIAFTAVGPVSPVEVGEMAVPQLAKVLAFPNPVFEQVEFTINVPHISRAQLRIYDVNGRLLRTLLDGKAQAGPHRLIWNGRTDAAQEVPRGVYFYRFEFDGELVATNKIVLMR
jgi:subtilisin family serine protease